MNGDGAPAPLFDQPPRYLPENLAGYLRTLLATTGLADTPHRSDVVALVEEAFGQGYGEGYERGHRDGQAERDAQYAHREDPALATSLMLPQVPLPIGAEDRR